MPQLSVFLFVVSFVVKVDVVDPGVVYESDIVSVVGLSSLQTNRLPQKQDVHTYTHTLNNSDFTRPPLSQQHFSVCADEDKTRSLIVTAHSNSAAATDRAGSPSCERVVCLATQTRTTAHCHMQSRQHGHDTPHALESPTSSCVSMRAATVRVQVVHL